MTRHKHCRICRRPAQVGQSMTEYVIVCGALAVALFMQTTNQKSTLWQLIDGFHAAYQHFSYAISLPT